MERERIVGIVSLQESKFFLYKYEKMGKGVCHSYQSYYIYSAWMLIVSKNGI
jgi:hypothetical protein